MTVVVHTFFYMKMATSYHTLYNWPRYVNTVLVLKVARQWGERLAPLMQR